MVIHVVTTDLLEMAYLERGPASGRPVLLRHGFPDHATSWDAVLERLATQGASAYRHGRTDTLTDARFEAALAAAPRAEASTTVLLGDDDGIEQPAVDDPRDAHFPDARSRRVLPGVGHRPPREAPDLVADALSGGPLPSSGSAQVGQ